MTFLSELSSKAAALSHPQKIFLILKNTGGKSIQISLPSVSPLIYSNRNWEELNPFSYDSASDITFALFFFRSYNAIPITAQPCQIC